MLKEISGRINTVKSTSSLNDIIARLGFSGKG
jgi:hypothetical protein